MTARARGNPARTSDPGDACDDRPTEEPRVARADHRGAARARAPICDPHHHLWDLQTARLVPRYLLDEILADTSAGHNVVSTVFIECGAMFKPDGPEALRPVGETEFVNGIAAMSASGLYGTTRVAAGIIGTADLRLGAAVGDVLDAQIAAGGGRFRGIRRAAALGCRPGRARRIAPIPGRACSRATTSGPASPSWRRAG